jgi:hypothetical protein
MMIALGCAWYLVGDLSVPKLSAQESAALIMLAATMLIFRTFRERYLLAWILGWLAYLVSRSNMLGPEFGIGGRYLLGISQTEFVLAVCLFAAAIFIYTQANKLILPLLVIAVSVMTFAVVRTIYWPNLLALRVALEVSY